MLIKRLKESAIIRRIVPLFLAVLLFGLAGCVGAPVKQDLDTSKLVWPPPPEVPRLKYVDMYRNNRDVEVADFAASIMGGVDVRMRLEACKGATADKEGRIYVTHRYGVAVFDTVKKEMRPFADLTAPYGIENGRGLTVGPSGNIYIADNVLRAVQVYTPKNNYVRTIGKNAGLVNPQGLAIDAQRNRLYVTDAKLNDVFVFSLEGELQFKIESSSALPYEETLSAPLGVAVNSKGFIYVVDQIGAKVNIYTPDGHFSRKIGRYGDSPGQFARPKGVAIDSEDNVYVSDAGFGNIQIFTPDDKLALFLGGTGSAPGFFNLPAMMYIDKHDRLYVAERGTNRVQVLQYMGDLYYREHPDEVRPTPPPAE